MTQATSFWSRPLPKLAGVVLFGLLAGCQYPYFIWIAAGSTATNLTFVHAFKEKGRSSGRSGYLWVESCARIAPDLTRTGPKRIWNASWDYPDSISLRGPLQVTYGTQPPGSDRRDDAPALSPGCYAVGASVPGHSGSEYFWVQADRTVAQFTEAEMDSMWAVQRRHANASFVADTQAGLRCLAAYQAARGDSAALRKVDRMIAYDTTRFSELRCEQLSRYWPELRAAGGTALPYGDSAPQVLLGSFVDDYGNHFEIGRWEWSQLPHGNFRIVKWVPGSRYLVAQNDSTNVHAPGKWTRIDWVSLEGMPPYEWAFCLSAYEAPTADSAEATRTATPATPRTGCNGYPYSRMKRVVEPGRAAADSAAKQKCREAYASAGADGAGLQEVDDMVPYDTTRIKGPSCGVLRRQDPRLRGAE